MFGTKKVLGYRSHSSLLKSTLTNKGIDTRAIAPLIIIHYSMLVTAILGLLAPLAAYTSYYFMFAILVAQVVLLNLGQ